MADIYFNNQEIFTNETRVVILGMAGGKGTGADRGRQPSPAPRKGGDGRGIIGGSDRSRADGD